MDRALLNETLEGGYIESYDIDLRKNRVAMRVEVLDGVHLSAYEVAFEKLSLLKYESDQSWRGDDYRLQVTDLYLDTTRESSSTEEWQVSISLWDTVHITLR
jgi:hypothetical protein